MKKIIMITVIVFLVSVVSLGVIFSSPDRLTPDHPAGKTIYYTIVENKNVNLNSDGRYEYVLASYDRKGREKRNTFTSSKPLREGAYLELYVAVFRGVTYWKEIQYNDLPGRVKEIYRY